MTALARGRATETQIGEGTTDSVREGRVTPSIRLTEPCKSYPVASTHRGQTVLGWISHPARGISGGSIRPETLIRRSAHGGHDPDARSVGLGPRPRGLAARSLDRYTVRAEAGILARYRRA